MRLNWYFLYHTISNSQKMQWYCISQVSTPTKTYLEQIIQYCTQCIYFQTLLYFFVRGFHIPDTWEWTEDRQYFGYYHLVVCQTWSSDVKQQQGCVSNCHPPPSHSKPSCGSELEVRSECLHSYVWWMWLTSNNEWMCTHFKLTSHKSEHIFTAHKSQMPLKCINLYLKPTHKDILKMDPSAALSTSNLLVTGVFKAQA